MDLIDAETKLLAPQTKPKLYARRWAMLFLFICLYFVNIIFQLSFVAIPDLLKKHYNVSTISINSVNLVFPMVEIPGLLVAIWVLQRFGLKPAIYCCAVLLMIGGGIRYGGADQYSVLIFGTVVASMAQPFLDASPTVLAVNWFGDDERTTAVSMFVFGWTISAGVGVSIIPIIVTDVNRYYLFLLGSAGLALCLGIINLWVQQEKPPTPPSAAATAESPPFTPSFFALIKNPSFIGLLISWGAVLGIIQGFYFSAATIFQPMYDEQTTGYISAASTASGLISTLVFGKLVDKYRCYKPVLIACYIGTAISLGAMGAFLDPEESGNGWILLGISACFGFCILPSYSVALELGAELTFPVSEQYSAALLVMVGDVWTVSLSYLLTYLKEEYAARVGIWVWSGIMCGVALITCFLSSDYKRFAYEESLKTKPAEVGSHGSLNQKTEDFVPLDSDGADSEARKSVQFDDQILMK